MRIAVVKPDHGIVGGFELVMRRISLELQQRGHEVHWLTIDVPSLPPRPYGVKLPLAVWWQAHEFFRYCSMAEAFESIDASAYDLVISTQPPSFAVHHPRQLALFSHHLRVYYDLADVFLESDETFDPAVYELARERIRVLDDVFLRRPKHILAASEVVKERLRAYNHLEANVGVYHAGVGAAGADTSLTPAPSGAALCVSRHEFPKRTELFVSAMHVAPMIRGTVVGGGGRLESVLALDELLAVDDPGTRSLSDRQLWLKRHAWYGGSRSPKRPRSASVEFLGHVTDDELSRLYAGALCVVAPALLEDYGLTAIEAMSYGKPLIVCDDGGSLTAFVEDGVNGFVVPPCAEAIAQAVTKLADEPQLALEMGERSREVAATYTWERAIREIEGGIDLVFDSAQAGRTPR
jgi:glycosyltransferase involved in cell wall biosynthesis